VRRVGPVARASPAAGSPGRLARGERASCHAPACGNARSACDGRASENDLPKMFVFGRLRIRGNLLLAARMRGWFRMPTA
jgi:hypothetical protein